MRGGHPGKQLHSLRRGGQWLVQPVHKGPQHIGHPDLLVVGTVQAQDLGKLRRKPTCGVSQVGTLWYIAQPLCNNLLTITMGLFGMPASRASNPRISLIQRPGVGRTKRDRS